MTPAEHEERDRMAYVLDALLATVAVALDAEQIVQAGEVQIERRQRPTRIDWRRRAAA